MTKKHRIIIFLVLTILFTITAPLTIFYSLGWRINLKTGEISQPGIFYFKVYPRNVKIFIDGKFKKKTDFFFGTAMIENLPSKKYNIEIKKDGYYDWKKTLEIKKGTATEAKNIVLFPKNPNFKALFWDIEEIFFSENGKKIIFKEKEKDDSDWSLKLFEPSKNIKSHLITEKDFLSKLNTKSKKTRAELLDLKFSPDQKRILIKLKIKEETKPELKKETENYYILNIDNLPAVLISLDFLNKEEARQIEKIDFNPDNHQILFLLYSEKTLKTDGSWTKEKIKKISKVDLLNEKILPPLAEKVIDYSIFENNLYYFDESGHIFKTDFSFIEKEKLSSLPLTIQNNSQYKITASKLTLLIKENDSLYSFDYKTGVFEKISDSVKGFKFNQGFHKIAYFNDNEIALFSFDKKNDTPEEEAKNNISLFSLPEKINQVYWLTDFYLVFENSGKIKITEIDKRGEINLIDFAYFLNPKIFWNQNEKILYVFANNTLFTSEKLTP